MKLLERIQDLKQEYHIGTLNALTYLRVRQDYEELAERLHRITTTKNIRSQPTIGELSNLCACLSRVFTNLLDLESKAYAIRHETTRIPKNHYFLDYSKWLTRYFVTNEYFSLEDNKLDIHWNLDYLNLAGIFYHEKEIKIDSEIALSNTVKKVMKSRYKFFTDLEGNKYNLNDIRSNENLLLSNLTYEDLEMDSMTYLEVDSFFVQDFIEWINYGNNLEFGLFNPNSITKEEKILLLGHLSDQNLYIRSKREKTLNKLEIERRIALNTCLQYDMHTINQTWFDIVIQSLNSRLSKCRRIMDYFVSTNAPEFFVDDERDLINRFNYEIMAVRQNRKWLERILNR